LKFVREEGGAGFHLLEEFAALATSEKPLFYFKEKILI
jgi:hypothetical protein